MFGDAVFIGSALLIVAMWWVIKGEDDV